MANHEALKIGLGTEYIGSTRVIVVPKFTQQRFTRSPVSDTARHEAKHAVVAEANGTSVKRVTIVPGPGYGGLTELSRFDPIAAMASHGEKGTGHDRLITRINGHDENAMARAAKDFISKNGEEVDAVANALDKNKTLDGNKVRKIMKEVYEEKNKPPMKKADVFISDTNGGQKEINNIDISAGTVMIPGEWVLLPVPDKPNLSQVCNSDTESEPNEQKDVPWSWAFQYSEKPVAA